MRPILTTAIGLITAATTLCCSQVVPYFERSDRVLSGARAPRGFVYVVQRGDMLSSIAPRLGTSVEALVLANGLANPNWLEVGQRLRVPPGARWADVEPRRPRPASSSAAPVATGKLLAVDGMIRDTEQRFRSARFEETLAEARKARSLLIPLQAEPGAGGRSARIDVLSAMAEVALGRDAAARESFQRALYADPSLTLAPGEVSPKILRLLEETQDQIVVLQASR
jgi:LysM repeat protein